MQFFVFFFKMATATILDFQTGEILLDDSIQRCESYHHATFHQNQSIYSEDIVIICFCQDGGRPPTWICLGHI